MSMLVCNQNTLSTIPAHPISPKIQNTSTFTSVEAHNIHSKNNYSSNRMDHEPFHENIKIEIPGPLLLYCYHTPSAWCNHSLSSVLPQSYQTQQPLQPHVSCLTCSQNLASQSRGVQEPLLQGLFGKKWPTRDTTEGCMAKQPWPMGT